MLEVALDWVASSQGKSIDAYLAAHRTDVTINELKAYFTSVIDWASGVFSGPTRKEMQGLDWGRLYEQYHLTPYDAALLETELETLLGDPAVTNRRGTYEYLLCGKSKPELLNVRLFDEKTKAAAYKRQTDRAKDSGVSNCPTCATVDNANKARIYKITEMEADHVTAWSNGGSSDLENCEVLCTTHNRAKGNR